MKLRNRRVLAVALAVIVTAFTVIAQTTPPAAPALQPQPAQIQPPPVVLPPPVVTPPAAPLAVPPSAAPKTNAPAKAAKKKSAPKKSDSKAKSAKKETPAKKESTGPAISATVKQPRVNLRGQPSLTGEVITQVHKGETVTILEEVPGKKGKAGEPAVWARIAMPTNTPVWVSALFVDTAASTVKSKKLNLRAGPGENYSVVGELKQGAALKQIRQNDNWIEIEAPATAYAFVALDLLDKGEPIAVAAKSAQPAKSTADKSGKATLAAATPLTTTEVKTEAPPAGPGARVAKVEPVTAPVEAMKPKVAAPPVPVVAEPAPAPPAVAQKAPKRRFYESTAGTRKGNPMETDRALYYTNMHWDPNAAPPVKRHVRREGTVHSTVSIQAPTYYQLTGDDSGEIIDYLFPSDPDMKLGELTGARVIVSGEEYLDPRWPKTPVLKIDKLEVAPDAAR